MNFDVVFAKRRKTNLGHSWTIIIYALYMKVEACVALMSLGDSSRTGGLETGKTSNLGTKEE